MINNSTNIFSQFNTLSTPAKSNAYSTSHIKNTTSNQTTKENKKSTFIKPIILFASPTAIGTGIGIKAKTLYTRLSEDIFQKQYNELDQKLITSFREDEIAKKYLEYIDTLKNRIDENVKGIEKANKLIEGLKIQYERENLKGIINAFESENEKLRKELVTAQKEHRLRYNNLIEDPLSKFKSEQLKQIASNKKKICAACSIVGILIGTLATYLYAKNNKGKTKNEN